MQLTDTLDTLHGLLAMANDAQAHLHATAMRVRSPSLGVLLRRQADARSTAAAELRALISAQGVTPDPADEAHCAQAPALWTPRAFFARSDHRRLLECEWRADATLARYRLALDSPLPENVRATLEGQLWRAQRDQEQLRGLREAAEVGRRHASAQHGLARMARLVAAQPLWPVGFAVAMGLIAWVAWRHAAQRSPSDSPTPRHAGRGA